MLIIILNKLLRKNYIFNNSFFLFPCKNKTKIHTNKQKQDKNQSPKLPCQQKTTTIIYIIKFRLSIIIINKPVDNINVCLVQVI